MLSEEEREIMENYGKPGEPFGKALKRLWEEYESLACSIALKCGCQSDTSHYKDMMRYHRILEKVTGVNSKP